MTSNRATSITAIGSSSGRVSRSTLRPLIAEPTARVRHPRHPTASVLAENNAGTGDEGLQFEGRVVKDSGPLRIRRVVELKSAIKAVAVDDVGADSSADSV